MTPHMLSKCAQNLYTVCPSDLVLKAAGEQNCLIALFLGKRETMLTKCKRLVLNGSFEPVWIRAQDFSYWIYSLNAPQQVTVQCQEVGSPQNSKSSYQIMLEGTRVLRNSSSCYVHAENFKLLPHSLRKTTVNLVRARMLLPNVENILEFSEESLLQTDAVRPMELQHLDGLIERVASRGNARGLDVNRATTVLQDREVYRNSSDKTLIIVVITVFIEVVIIWLIWCRIAGRCWLCKWKCMRQSKPSRNVNNDQELRETGTRLQIEQSGREGEREAAEIEMVYPTTPPVFVRRAHLEADHPH
jgi:hypothetical protein